MKGFRPTYRVEYRPLMGKQLCSPTKAYRKTLESIVKLVPPDQIAPVELRESKYGSWEPHSAVIRGELKEGPEYFHACAAVRLWERPMSKAEYEPYGVVSIYRNGEVHIPNELCGLVNHYFALTGKGLITQRSTENGTIVVLTPLGHKVLTIAKEISDVG